MLDQTCKFKGLIRAIWSKLFVGGLLPEDSYWLTRRVFATGLGLIYLNAFLIFLLQGPGLLGSNGILPISDYVMAIQSHFGSLSAAFYELPSLFHFISSTLAIRTVGIIGLLFSISLIFGFASFPILFVLWFLQLSIVHTGQIFYSYGWETQLLELTFLSFFLFPLWDPRLNQEKSPPKKIAILFQRWMLFRLMLGAGLIKIRGDQCWRDLTCTNYHYETQPNPHPASWFWHQMPEWIHWSEVLYNHFIELVIPFFIFGPKWARRIAGILLVLFQLSLIISGNLAWLNWITIVMVIPCFDDAFLYRVSRILGLKTWAQKFLRLTVHPLPIPSRLILGLFAFTVTLLSIKPAINLISDKQMMNASFNQLHLINSYGAFGSIGKVRNEVIILGTSDSTLSPTTVWKEYEFKCKPSDPQKAPCLITPYHLRLDWQIWFSAMHPQISEQWLVNLAVRLLQGQPEVTDLLAKNPFKDAPPKFIKMDLYRYHFTSWGDKPWWRREFLKSYMQPVSL